ncbi:MAG: cysteine desulfurase, cysteine desulfurase [Candidatus Saccharibacteria bacterium]|nr:cysteine desulfurase, cysteine desulfurase [Candidatus Saccharibacteria bacterium]
MDERVITAMLPYFQVAFFNPSSPYAPAVAVRRAYEAAKESIARQIGGKADELVMTAGATESVNLAIHQAAGHVIVAATEHHSVLRAAQTKDHTILDVDEHGRVSLDHLRRAIRPDTELISIALANNEIGTIQPLRDIAAMIKEIRIERRAQGNSTRLLLHSDASQGVGQLDIHVARLGVDLLTLNAAKMYGPKQVGLLWASSQVVLRPLLAGGGQEHGVRSGTENVAGVIGFERALTLVSDRRESEVQRLETLKEAMRKELTAAFPDAVLSGHPKHQLAGHLHISFAHLDAERVLFALESRGVLVATGSACAANKGTRSHVLEAIGMSPEVADGSLRITFGHLSSSENTALASRAIIEEVKREYERMHR